MEIDNVYFFITLHYPIIGGSNMYTKADRLAAVKAIYQHDKYMPIYANYCQHKPLVTKK